MSAIEKAEELLARFSECDKRWQHLTASEPSGDAAPRGDSAVLSAPAVALFGS